MTAYLVSLALFLYVPQFRYDHFQAHVKKISTQGPTK